MPNEKVNNLFNRKKHGENTVYSNGINDVKSRLNGKSGDLKNQ